MKEHTLKQNSLMTRMITFTTETTDLTFYVQIPDTPYWFPCGVLISADIKENFTQMVSDYVIEFLHDDDKGKFIEIPYLTDDLIDDIYYLDAPDCTLNLDGCTKTSITLKNPSGANGGWEYICASCNEKIGDSQ